MLPGDKLQSENGESTNGIKPDVNSCLPTSTSDPLVLDFGVDALHSPSEDDIQQKDVEEGEIDITIDDEQELNIVTAEANHPRTPETPLLSRSNSHRSRYTSYVEEKRLYTRTLYVGDLPQDITDDKLIDIFRKYGEIVDIDIKYLRYGVATYAFIQYVDPMSAIAAKENETNSKIGGSYIKIGFGRANVYDTIWVGGYEPNNLKTLLEKVQALPGFVWSLTDKVLNQTIIKFYKMGNSSDAQDKIDRFSPPLDNLKIDFMSTQAAKKFVSRMEKSGQSVNEAILRDYDMQKRSHYIDNSSDDSPKYIQKHKEHHAKTSRVSERLARKHDDSSSEEPAKKRRHPSHSPTHGSDDSKINSLDSHSRSRTRNREKSHEKRPFKIWSGELHLKRKSVHVMFKFFKGNRTVFDACLAKMVKGEEKLRVLQIEQRMVLDKEHYSLINYRLKKADDSAFAIAIVDDKYPDDESSLCKHFMEYFTEKNAAGVINIHDSKHHDLTHVLYAFPDCSFARVHTKDAPSEIRDVMSTQSYLLILALRCH